MDALNDYRLHPTPDSEHVIFAGCHDPELPLAIPGAGMTTADPPPQNRVSMAHQWRMNRNQATTPMMTTAARTDTMETCKERVADPGVLGTRICGREVKTECGDGIWRCGPHTTGYNRRQRSMGKHQLERDASARNRARAVLAGEWLSEFGITASPHYHWERSRYSGYIVVDPDGVACRLGN